MVGTWLGRVAGWESGHNDCLVAGCDSTTSADLLLERAPDQERSACVGPGRRPDLIGTFLISPHTAL